MPDLTFPPRKDADLLAWSDNFDTKITATPVVFGLTAAQATAYTVLHDDFRAKYALANNENTNSKTNIGNKNTAKQELLYGTGGAWELVNIVQAFPGTTDDMRRELQLRIPDNEMTPAPIPGTAPDLSIIASMGRVVRIRLRDQDSPDRRGKPEKTQGATILFHVGEDAPAEGATWVFLMNTSKTLLEVEIPGSVAAGSKVWITAFWFNAKKQTSPAATAEYFRVSDGVDLKQAA